MGTHQWRTLCCGCVWQGRGSYRTRNPDTLQVSNECTLALCLCLLLCLWWRTSCCQPWRQWRRRRRSWSWSWRGAPQSNATHSPGSHSAWR